MLNLLLIDDDPNQHKILSCFLRKKYGADADFTSALDLDEALAHLAGQSFDVIFLDNRLPPYSDFTETIGGIVDISPDSDIYLISADRDKVSLNLCKSHGIVEMIDKFELREAVSEGLLG
ncbi:Response regulator receiver domain protein [Hoeflea sp. IMCC20628]|uniref:response regulator n=1 Tax=Hoeflea sp. IMCC20628 TaxID=1620421 RepID=UPI00063ADF4E|nr:response regulator [Hoeflea sp. IMCC20628]AKI01190.1 Response regulator receiver domain protein [Hoeflea sp. IMCC20628]